MARVTVSINLSLEDHKEFERIIEATRLEYNIAFPNQKRCTKGKAMMYLLKNGREKYSEIINERFRLIDKQKKKGDALEES